MCAKNLNEEMEKLHALVSKLDPNSKPSDDSYIEEVETTPPAPKPKPKTSRPKPATTPPKPMPRPATTHASSPPPTQQPNILQRTFSFEGTVDRNFFFGNTLVLAVLAAIVINLVDTGELHEGWGIFLLALSAWSLVATTAKRWRDTGYNMLWLWTLAIPYANLLTLVFLFLSPSKKNP